MPKLQNDLKEDTRVNVTDQTIWNRFYEAGLRTPHPLVGPIHRPMKSLDSLSDPPLVPGGAQQCTSSFGKSMQTVPGGWRIDTIDWPPCYLKFNRTPLGDDVLVHLKSPDHISHYQSPDPDLGGNPPGDISLGECPDIRHAYKHVGSHKLLSTKYQHKGVFEFT